MRGRERERERERESEILEKVRSKGGEARESLFPAAQYTARSGKTPLARIGIRQSEREVRGIGTSSRMMSERLVAVRRMLAASDTAQQRETKGKEERDSAGIMGFESGNHK